MVATAEDLYPSRVSDAPDVIERQDPVVYGDASERGGGPLTAAQLDEFDRHGFLFLPDFLSEDQVAACNQELRRLCADEAMKRRPEAVLEPEADALRSLFRVHQLSPFYSGVASDERIARMAMQILGSEVCIHQSRVNLKPGFVGKDFYWHSDFETWHIEDGMPRMRAVSCSILLTPNYPFNGPLMLVPGSHRTFIPCPGQTPRAHYEQSLKRQKLGVPTCERLTELVREGGVEQPTGRAGSILLFDCNTMHGSNSNITPFPRSNLFFVYNSVENRLTEPFCGREPRPEFLGARERADVIEPAPFHYGAG